MIQTFSSSPYLFFSSSICLSPALPHKDLRESVIKSKAVSILV